jgi:hypothetical protein
MLLARFEQRVTEWWVENHAPMERREDAAQFADMGGDEWQAQIEDWADRARQQAGVDGPDRKVVDTMLRNTYGVGLDEFEELVVEWPVGDEDERGRRVQVMRDVFATPVEQVERTIRDATEAIDE